MLINAGLNEIMRDCSPKRGRYNSSYVVAIVAAGARVGVLEMIVGISTKLI